MRLSHSLNLVLQGVLLSFLVGFAACKPADTLSPRWDIAPAPPKVVVLGDTLPDFVVIAEDNRDFDINERVVAEGRVNTDRWGDYPLTYRVEDEARNSADTTFSVKVTMAPRSYYSTDWTGRDSCSDGSVFSYPVVIQDCDCPEDRVVLFNLGNFGVGTIFNFDLEGDYLESYRFGAVYADAIWTGNGSASRSGDTMSLFWNIRDSLAMTVLQCNTQITR